MDTSVMSQDRSLSIHQEHELLLKLEQAGLNKELAQKVIASKDNQLANDIVRLLEGTHTIVPVHDPLNHPDVIKKIITVDYRRSKPEALDGTERKQYTNDEVVEIAPARGERVEEKEVFFLPFSAIPERYRTHESRISEDDLQRFFDDHDLVSEDLHTAAKVSEDDPSFADEKPYGIHFKDQRGRWCWAVFCRWNGGRKLLVDRIGNGWVDTWWFLVSRK